MAEAHEIATAFARRLRANADHAEALKFTVCELGTMDNTEARLLAGFIEKAVVPLRADEEDRPMSPPNDPRIKPLQNAIEGECDGLDLSDDQARAVLGHVDREAIESMMRLVPVTTAPAQGQVAVPEDVVRLVLAARDVAFTSDPTPEALKELDAASEAFADRVPWDDEPLPEEAASPVSPAAEQKVFPQDFEPAGGWPRRLAVGDIAALKDGRIGKIEEVGAVIYGLRMTDGEFITVHHESVSPAADGGDAWLIFYHDPDVRPEIFMGEGAEAAARASWEQAQINWTCDLFRSVRRDEALASHTPAQQPFDPAASPGMTDMMVDPSTLDAFMEADPLPEEPAPQPGGGAELGRWLKALRLSRKLSLRDVERITEGRVSNPYLCQLEGGKIKRPSAMILHQLAAAYAIDYAAIARHAGYETASTASQPGGAAFGIIDPDYARVFTQARAIAWQEGYAIMMHGSFTRDLDLLAVPWTDAACEPEHLVRRIETATKLKNISRKPGKKPHGRLAWTLTFPTFGDPRFVDLGIMPRALPLPTPPAGEG